MHRIKQLDVVVGVVLSGDRVLVCQRRHDNPSLPGVWEFPGGKQEPGESAEACLHRELDEELAIRVRPIARLATVEHRYPAANVRLHPFVCAHESGEPQAVECEQHRWVRPDELPGFTFPPANGPLLAGVRQWLEENGVEATNVVVPQPASSDA